MSSLVLQVIVVGFAAYRLARVVAQDTITDRPRRWLYHHAGYAPDIDDGPPVGMSLKRITTHGYSTNPTRIQGPWRWLYGLVSCPFCCGWWIALALFLVWQGWSWQSLLGGVAAAGVQAALTATTT